MLGLLMLQELDLLQTRKAPSSVNYIQYTNTRQKSCIRVPAGRVSQCGEKWGPRQRLRSGAAQCAGGLGREPKDPQGGVGGGGGGGITTISLWAWVS
jgi:hypothetical protein